jgi:hypothetical protein
VGREEEEEVSLYLDSGLASPGACVEPNIIEPGATDRVTDGSSSDSGPFDVVRSTNEVLTEKELCSSRVLALSLSRGVEVMKKEANGLEEFVNINLVGAALVVLSDDRG